MSQGLHLSQRMSLSQVLAPQLQQSLALLQAPTLELKALVEQELQNNALLEEVPAAEVELSERVKEGDGDGAAEAPTWRNRRPTSNSIPPPKNRATRRWMIFKWSLSA